MRSLRHVDELEPSEPPMRQPKTPGKPLSSVAPVLALQPLEPACARHGGNAIVAARN